LTRLTTVRQINLSVYITRKSDRRVPCYSVKLELYRWCFLRRYVPIQRVMDVKGSRLGSLGGATSANCTTDTTKPEQFARCRRIGCNGWALPKTCK
jgi:hypothetical protein